jgi:Cu2+-containing amine oxidase
MASTEVPVSVRVRATLASAVWHAQVGDYGLGYCSNSLELGCDCLGTIKYFDADMINSKGAPLDQPYR